MVEVRRAGGVSSPRSVRERMKVRVRIQRAAIDDALRDLFRARHKILLLAAMEIFRFL